MQTDRDRRRMLVSMGIAEPIPSLDVQRAWCWIDDRTPPDGKADGQFDSFVTWVHKAASWIGWTGAKCFDAKHRPCRNGADMQRARDENAFPVRWYWPDRFPQPLVASDRAMRIRCAVAAAGAAGISVDELRQVDRLGNLGRREADAVLRGRVSHEDDRYVMSAEGAEQTGHEEECRRRASYVRN